MHRICDVSCVVGVHGFQIPSSPGRSSGGELLSRLQRTVNNPVSNSSWPLNRSTEDSFIQGWPHPRRPRGSQSGREKMRDESFQVRAEEPLGTHSHRTISKSSSRCRLLIGHKKCFELLCQSASTSPEFFSCVRTRWLLHGLSGSCTKEMHEVRKLLV